MKASEKNTFSFHTLEQGNKQPEIICGDMARGIIQAVITMHEVANAADDADEIRGTITKVDFNDSNSMTLFCDIRGGDQQAMEKVVEKLNQMTERLPKVKAHFEEQSFKKPVRFNQNDMKHVEDILETEFPEHVMKGHMSVPGQDIGNVAGFGIPSALLFVESGTGHHPYEYLRPEAMKQAFDATLAIVQGW
jgi:acetylornithine deacetylase/succinyl-diaminopimelate desuccinylase-like protein